MTAVRAVLDRQAKIVLAAALGAMLLLTAAVWLLVISPKRSEAADLRTKLAAAEDKLGTQRSQQPVVAGVTVAEVRALERALPDGAQTAGLVRNLDRLARRAGVTLDTVTPQAEIAGAGYKTIPLAVVVDGNFFGIRRFLRLLRSEVRVRGGKVHGSGRLYDVQAIDVQQSESLGPNVRATLTMQAFAFAGSAGTPAAAATASASPAEARG
jgi:Tfp pilus assembly protein PilO